MIVYAAKHKNEKIRDNSRSGAIFTALSDLFLNGGVVYGCVLDDDFNAVHIRTENAEGRDKMRGSKYIQSTMGKTFMQVKEDLENGKNVLFSGTSCQIAGLQRFLHKEYENLLCVDIVCHGVPSPKVWHAFLEWKTKGKKIKKIDFRNKIDYGWRAHIESIYLDECRIDSVEFRNLFYNHNILRPSCYKCPYKSIHHPGDITIADYWGIEKAAPEFDDNRGVSLVLVNSEKGSYYFEQAKKDIFWKKTRIEDSMQPPLLAPFPCPQSRKKFWSDFEKKDFSFIAKKYGKQKSDIGKRVIRKGMRVLRRLFGQTGE